MYEELKEIFKKFQKERHAEDKKKHYNLLQETYANTILFYFKDTPINKTYTPNIIHDICSYCDEKILNLKELSLPFKNIFAQVFNRQFLKDNKLISENYYLFLREFDPEHITGTLYTVSENYTINTPFTIDISLNCISWDNKYSDNILFLNIILESLKILCNLHNKYVIKSTPTNNIKEYFPRKKDTTIQVQNRPLYYVYGTHKDMSSQIKQNKNYTYEILKSFLVRGHWRKINSESIGKDREGLRCVHGYTWISEYKKGADEPVSSLRIVKNQI